MTMEVELPVPSVADDAENIDRDAMIDHLTNNEKICFKSQQRGEADLSKDQKTNIALDLFDKSKLNFLVRFGQHLEKNHLDFYQQFTQNDEESYEIGLVLRDLMTDVSKRSGVKVKNRRYEALRQMVDEDAYFSEIEMMKRNPLLYEQLVGQYLTDDEKRERDRSVINENSTLVKVLMEGIERDNAELRKKEEQVKEEDDNDGDDEIEERQGSPQPCYSRWGEFEDEPVKIIRPRPKVAEISVEEQQLLKEEFVTSMYQAFLDGKDEDFDYDSVDNNDKYDNMEIKEYDDEDEYFDSEEPQVVKPPSNEESEDELDIFMSGLNNNPNVAQLSKDMQNM